jgi:hypothetical protein
MREMGMGMGAKKEIFGWGVGFGNDFVLFCCRTGNGCRVGVGVGADQVPLCAQQVGTRKWNTGRE